MFCISYFFNLYYIIIIVFKFFSNYFFLIYIFSVFSFYSVFLIFFKTEGAGINHHFEICSLSTNPYNSNFELFSK